MSKDFSRHNSLSSHLRWRGEEEKGGGRENWGSKAQLFLERGVVSQKVALFLPPRQNFVPLLLPTNACALPIRGRGEGKLFLPPPFFFLFQDQPSCCLVVAFASAAAVAAGNECRKTHNSSLWLSVRPSPVRPSVRLSPSVGSAPAPLTLGSSSQLENYIRGRRRTVHTSSGLENIFSRFRHVPFY